MAQPNAPQRAPHFPPDEQGNITIPASLVGTGKEGELPSGDIKLRYSDTGKVELYGNLRGPRGRRHPYSLHLELCIRLMAAEIERLRKQITNLEKAGDTEQITSELEAVKAAREQLDNQLEAIREAHRKEIEELREQLSQLHNQQAGDTSRRQELENLLQLLIALFEDQHTVFDITKMTDAAHPLYRIDLGTIVLYYTADENSAALVVDSKHGVRHPIRPQHIELYGTQPNESGLTYISVLAAVVEDPCYAETTAKWTEERIKRLFVNTDTPPAPSRNSLEVYVLPGMEHLGQLATSVVVEIPDDTDVSAESTDSSASNSSDESPAEDPTASWKQ